MRHPEQDLQRECAKLLDSLGWLWCHVPNGGKRSKIEAAILQGLGVKSGVPDLLIFEHYTDANRGDLWGLAVELKAPHGKVTIAQSAWLRSLKSRGWMAVVCRSMDDFISVLKGVRPQNMRRLR